MKKTVIALVILLLIAGLVGTSIWYYPTWMAYRQPSSPTVLQKVTITSQPPGARLFTRGPQGNPTQLMGTTPLTINLGFAPLRAWTGSITNWIRWHGDTELLWEHSAHGEVFLNAVLLRDGYEPQLITNRALFVIDPETSQDHYIEIPLLRPTHPSTELELVIESEPAGAMLYTLKPDGTPNQQLGDTPLKITIGLAQQLTETTSGQVAHADWLIWDQVQILRWQVAADGAAAFILAGALLKEGYAPTPVWHPVFDLVPGQPIPDRRTVTIPLQKTAATDSKLDNVLTDAGTDTGEAERSRIPRWPARLIPSSR